MLPLSLLHLIEAAAECFYISQPHVRLKMDQVKEHTQKEIDIFVVVAV